MCAQLTIAALRLKRCVELGARLGHLCGAGCSYCVSVSCVCTVTFCLSPGWGLGEEKAHVDDIIMHTDMLVGRIW